jgi:hypothetical protein
MTVRLLQKKPGQEQGGYVLLLTLVMSISLFIALGGILSLGLINLASAKRSLQDTSALYVAEAGGDKAVFEINKDATYAGTNTTCPIGSTGSNPVTLFNNTYKGKGTYETCVVSGTIAHEKIVYSVGKVYATATSTTPISTRKLKLVVEGSPAGAYAVQTGPGGLIMRNSASLANGPVYIGGYLTMSNSATIGSVASPIAVNVANARCPSPADSTFPQICAQLVQPNPITLGSNQNHIYGSVCSNGQTVNTNMSNPGLVCNSGVAAPALPDYDRTGQKAAVTNNLTGAAASCTSNNGSVTWPVNVKITGDVTVSHSCTVLVSGNAWITGNFTMSQSAIIKPAAAVTVQPTIMVDGSSGVTLNNQSSIATNAGNIGLEFITYYSAVGCSVSSDCAVTGANLYNSQNLTTISVGNQGAAPGSVFYARWSKVTVGQGGTIGALLGQTIDIGNSGNLSFVDTVSTNNYTYDVRYYELQ